MESSVPLKDKLLDLAPDSQFVYIDTGAPLTDKAYTTWICVHGMAHNHKTWRDMAATIPPNTRLLAYSLRGYKGSSPFTEDVSSHSEIQARVGNDFAAVTTAFIDQLSLLSHPDSRVKVICWSLGNVSVINAYRLLSQGLLSAEKKHALSQQVSEIVFFEPPCSSTLGFERSATGKLRRHQQTNGLEQSPEQKIQTLMDHLLGIWEYPESFTAGGEMRSIEDRPGVDVVFEMTATLNGDPETQKRMLDGINDFSCLPYCIASAAENTLEERESVRDGLRAMLGAPGIEKLKPLTVKTTLPDCVEGTFLIGAILRDLDLEVKSGTEIKVIVVEGRYTHYLHNHAPELLWEKIK